MSDNDSDNQSGDDANLLDIDEEEILEQLRLLSWTRLMSIEGYQTGEERKWPLGPDVVEEC